MAITLGEVVQAVRLRHPFYAAELPNRLFVEAAGRLQRRLALLGTQKYSGWLAQQAPIYLRVGTDNRPGVAGVGTTGGLPANDGDLSQRFATAGQAPFYDLDTATVVLDDFAPTTVAVGASTTVVTLTGAGRTVNADAGLGLWAVQGPGSGPQAVQVVTSNTATAWTLPNYQADPSTATLFRLIELPSATEDGTAGLFVDAPGVQHRSAYVVKVNSAGVAYLDLTEPMVATLPAGMTLPPHDRLLGLRASVAPSTWTGDADPTTFPITGSPAFMRIPILHGQHRGTRGPVAYVEGDQLYLGGPSAYWSAWRNLVLTYVPIPPLFTVSRTVLDDPFLLPDTAMDVLVEGLTVTAAERAKALGQDVDVNGAKADYVACQDAWLRSIGQRGGALLQISGRNR